MNSDTKFLIIATDYKAFQKELEKAKIIHNIYRTYSLQETVKEEIQFKKPSQIKPLLYAN